MPVTISIAKGTSNPTSVTGLTLGEPAFNYSNNTLWIGKGSGNSPVWVGAGVCGASGGIAAGLTTQLPTHAAVKNYFDAVSSSFLGTTASYVATFNGLTGAIQGVSAAVAGSYITVSAATGSVTITNTGVQTFNGLTGTIQGVSSWNGQTGAVSFVNYVSSFNGATGAVTGVCAAVAGTGISVSGATGSVTITNIGVQSFNGRTGAVQGVSSAAAGTGISISAATGAITITNTGVQTFNGLTGAVTGVTVGGANTFTALQTFNSGISASNLVVSGGVTLAGNLVVIDSPTIQLGDVNGAANSTTIVVDDDNDTVTVNANTFSVNANGFSVTGTIDSSHLVTTDNIMFGAGEASINSETTTLGTTAANQTISITETYDGGLTELRSFEFFVQASTGSAFEAIKIIAIHDGTNTYNTQYGVIRSGSSLCSSYTTTLVAGPGVSRYLRLRATPTNTNTTFKVVKTVIPG